MPAGATAPEARAEAYQKAGYDDDGVWDRNGDERGFATRKLVKHRRGDQSENESGSPSNIAYPRRPQTAYYPADPGDSSIGKP